MVEDSLPDAEFEFVHEIGSEDFVEVDAELIEANRKCTLTEMKY